MSPNLKAIQEILQQHDKLSEQDKERIIKSIAEADKAWNVTEATEGEKREAGHATAMLLEQTMKEMERQHEIIDAQKRELEIEASLEKVRVTAMAMKEAADMLEICEVICMQLESLHVKDIRNVQTAIFNEPKGTYMNYEFYRRHDRKLITDVEYRSHPMSNSFGAQMLRGQDAVFTTSLVGKELKDWVEYQKTTNQFIDTYLDSATSLNYYWYSIGPIALGISTYTPLSEEDIALFKRFRKVFELTYRRYLDIEKAAFQARETRIELAMEKVRASALAMKEPADMLDVCRIICGQLQELGVSEIRNVQTAIVYESRGIYTNYEYYALYDKSIVTDIEYKLQPEGPAFINQILQSPDGFFTTSFSGDRLKEWMEYHIKSKFFVDPRLTETESVHYYFFSISNGGLGLSTYTPLDNEAINLFKRFRNVFELAYRRFMDIEKATAQAREAQVELGLERVRARALAMQKSSEVMEVALTLYEELQKLDFRYGAATIVIMDKDSGDMEHWVAGFDQIQFPECCHIPYFKHPCHDAELTAWKNGEKWLVYQLSGEEKKSYDEYFFEKTGYKNFPESEKIWMRELASAHFSLAFIKHGALHWATSPLSQDQAKILQRFANVFEQSYTRFLDLQRAEAQAREGQIELALERVRARTMAMHKSEELAESAQVMFHQITELGDHPARIAIGIPDEEERVIKFWTTDQVGISIEVSHNASFDEPTTIAKIVDAWKAKKKSIVIDLQGGELDEWIHFVRTEMKLQVKDEFLKNRRVHNVGFFSHGLLLFTTHEPLGEEMMQILERFAAVFNLTYRRFLDLKNAEAQTREAQVEAGLERARAKAMAMHNTEDLAATISVFYRELSKLSVTPRRCGLGLIDRETRMEEVSSMNTTEEGGSIKVIGKVKLAGHPIFDGIFEHWLLQKEYRPVLKGEEIKAYYQFLRAKIPMPDYPNAVVQFGYFFFFPEGLMFTWTNQELVEEELTIYRRFTSVLSLTYKRYQDLMKAEAQVREAKIDAALERVRAKAMSMHSSKDLTETIKSFYHELTLLSETPRRCGVALINKQTRMAELSTMNTTEMGESIEVIGELRMEGHPILDGIFEHWLIQKEFHAVLRGNEIKEYYRILRPHMSFPDYPHDVVQFGYYFMFNEGDVYAWTEKELAEDELKIYRRFTSVISLTYKRYKDLVDAESRALAAIRQASLDRIRAEIASMRTADDLQHITPSVWRELTALGVPFFRCGVFIINEKDNLVHIYLTTPDAKPLAVLHLGFDHSEIIRNTVAHWREQKVYTERWDRDTFTAWVKSLMGHGQVYAAETYQSGETPPESLVLQHVPFPQGMLYVGSAEELTTSQIELVQALADAFSVAYARYEDFKRLEEAKAQIEATLSKLKATQGQLIQSEKMASLGELTAGIAHEIQNPLNFVNNFSDVSNELLEEMKGELEKGHGADALALADAVKQNLEKILHHGKRADAIVKGMLQHSRTSTGQKEPTDINALADEYLRLAYHGLRAKDKSFNASFRTDLDESIGKINILPQDMGRVLVNLINNAFYAVTERKKQNIPGYEPTVTVSTKKKADKIELRVIDNGNGIPDKVLDKIFQPFFTTKPTGQGTGLGLSLSFDIITKGHGGEMSVETKEGEGTEFIIQLPVA